MKSYKPWLLSYCIADFQSDQDLAWASWIRTNGAGSGVFSELGWL